MYRNPAHPDAEGIADDGGDESGEDQSPAAKTVIQVHQWIPPAASALACREGEAESEACALILALDVAYERFAYMGNKVIERPVFFLASIELALQFGFFVLIRLPQRRLVYLRDSHWTSLSPDGPSSLATRSVVSFPHFMH
jgi:hypothetical protein